MNIKKIKEIQTNPDTVKYSVGDYVAVSSKIVEGKKIRIQVYKGLIIKIQGGNSSTKTITVRKRSFGVGVEKTFMANSPLVKEIKIEKSGRVRRSKLYYIRDRVGKSEKLQIKQNKKVIKST